MCLNNVSCIPSLYYTSSKTGVIVDRGFVLIAFRKKAAIHTQILHLFIAPKVYLNKFSVDYTVWCNLDGIYSMHTVHEFTL